MDEDEFINFDEAGPDKPDIMARFEYWFRERFKREPQLGDYARYLWGAAGDVGFSQNSGHHNRQSRSSDDGILDQT